METLQKITAFLNKYRWAITLGLFVCCVMQQCTINTLRDEIHFLKDKYELTANTATPHSSPASDEVVQHDSDGFSTSSDFEERAKAKKMVWIYVAALSLCLVLVWIICAKLFSLWPFNASVKGKLWQDLNGRVVYTLTVKNRGRKDISVGNAIIEFISFKEKRKFKAPVTDFPITLSKGTAHAVNIPIQKLIEQHRELMDFKAIRMSVECNGKQKFTLPVGVKWKTA